MPQTERTALGVHVLPSAAGLGRSPVDLIHRIKSPSSLVPDLAHSHSIVLGGLRVTS